MQGSMAARAARTYYETQVQSQTPMELVVMLYDGLLRWLNAAADAIDRRDMVAKREAVSRSLAIVSELQSTLNMKEGGEVATSLDGIYTFASGQLLQANMSVTAGPVRDVIKVIAPLRDAWTEAARAASQGARPGEQK